MGDPEFQGSTNYSYKLRLRGTAPWRPSLPRQKEKKAPSNLKFYLERSTIVLMEDLGNNPREVIRDAPHSEIERQGVSSPILPQSLEDLGLPPIFLAQLTLKHCFFLDVFLLGDLVERLKISASIISRILDYLKKEKYVEVRGPDPLSPTVRQPFSARPDPRAIRLAFRAV